MSEATDYSESGQPIYKYGPRERPFELAHGDAQTIEAVERHVRRHVGDPDSVYHELVSDLVHIDVHKVSPAPERNFITLVTSGMSDRPMIVPDGCDAPAFAELLICLPADWPLGDVLNNESNYWPVRLMKLLARFPHEYDTWLGFGHTVPNGDPPRPYAGDTKLCAALIAPPVRFGDAFRTLTVSDDKVVEFYSVIPLYAEELEYKLSNGTEPLLDRFDEAGINELLDPKRPNTCRKKRFGFF